MLCFSNIRKYQADQFIPLPLEETAIDLDIIYEDKANKKIVIDTNYVNQHLNNLIQDSDLSRYIL